MSTQYAAAWAFASALIIAACTAAFAYYRYVREQEHQRRTLLNALFGELANVLEHCTYAAVELPTDHADVFELKRRLRWSKYGQLRSVNDVGKMGFLDASSIKALLQLELRLRNDAIVLDQFLEDLPSATTERLLNMRRRLAHRVLDVHWLLKRLVDSRPELERALVDLRKELPVVEQ